MDIRTSEWRITGHDLSRFDWPLRLVYGMN